MNDGILFDVSNLRHLSDTLDDGAGETPGVALEETVVHLADTNRTISRERIFLVSGLEEVEMVVHDRGVDVVLQHDDVGVVENLFRMLGLESMERGEGERRPLAWDVMGGRQWSSYDGGDEEGETQGREHRSMGEATVRNRVAAGQRTPQLWYGKVPRDKGRRQRQTSEEPGSLSFSRLLAPS